MRILNSIEVKIIEAWIVIECGFNMLLSTGIRCQERILPVVPNRATNRQKTEEMIVTQRAVTVVCVTNIMTFFLDLVASFNRCCVRLSRKNVRHSK